MYSSCPASRETDGPSSVGSVIVRESASHGVVAAARRGWRVLAADVHVGGLLVVVVVLRQQAPEALGVAGRRRPSCRCWWSSVFAHVRLVPAGCTETVRRRRCRQIPKISCSSMGTGDVELLVGARRRLAVGAPALEPRGVAEAVALQVLVGDLGDELDAQRLPAQVLARVPPALPRRAGAGRDAAASASASAHSRHGWSSSAPSR